MEVKVSGKEKAADRYAKKYSSFIRAEIVGSFLAGGTWQKEECVERLHEWIRLNFTDHPHVGLTYIGTARDGRELLSSLRKAMEDI